MGGRLGLGPVFAYEWLTTARRWQVYASRSLFVGGMLTALLFVWWSQSDGYEFASLRAQARVGEAFFCALVGTEIALVMLVAPAATAGAVCLDKSRGTLAHIMVTDLSDSEIVLGKLAARLVPVVGLVLCAQPMTALATLLGGIDPEALTGATLISLGSAVLASSLALLLSVWGRKTQEVLLLSYAILTLWTLGGPALWMLRWTLGWSWKFPEWFTRSNPFWLALSPYFWPGTITQYDYYAFLAGTLLLSAVLALISVWRVRAVASRQWGEGPRWRWNWGPVINLRRWTRFLPGPRLDPNPVLWREWHRNRPSWWTRLVWGLYWSLVVAITALQIDMCLEGVTMRLEIASILTGGEVALGLLLMSVVAPSALNEERVRGSLDVLLATPMSTPAIVWGKWWGSFRPIVLLAIAPGVIATLIAFRNGNFLGPFLIVTMTLVYGAALNSLGLALATWTKRPGRAIALSASAYILMTVGWMFFAILLTARTPGSTGPGLAAGSPFIGVGFVGVFMQRPERREWEEFVPWIFFWMIAYAGAAAGLLAATIATFDRCMSRMTPVSDEIHALAQHFRTQPPGFTQVKPVPRDETIVRVGQ